ncbi:tRNA lysidine(34) synthetase TilS [Pseudonocardia asaccharolytica]|uniref:tRNA(Ile)-lysidine synthase n=1 Tax=Pseudonocardia asaccharolytica DSM 44247 = NBRC 16224 TaxID=1123024 RepID=A0A511CY18_9PSEU|nr:tRNA lysidine(34) synthetase TilS [Pseudonocardia asaccharolytica]GEL17465.1 tRNA(Ile)-lysidine synthase [Pseudonocardia asaccharolytica DSM 44247 = NBRC 16224]
MSRRPDPALTAVRLAVRRGLAALPAAARAAPPVVACSGGADSLTLAFAVRALHPGRVRAVIIDHGLQAGSAERSAELAALLSGRGIPSAVRTVTVEGPGGVEAAARRARYAALAAARPHPDSPVLLGHTLDDQAETVLLGLGRGSGPRSIAGMRPWDPPWARPLLGVRRAVTRAACRSLGLPVWDDPHNIDPRFTRVRLRHEVLPLLEEVLAGGVAEALARTAGQLQEDGEALEGWAARVRAAASDAAAPGGGLRSADLAPVPPAVRRRVLRDWLLDAGAKELTDGHLRSADDLVGRWRGQGGVAIPGGLELVRRDGTLLVRRTEAPPGG